MKNIKNITFLFVIGLTISMTSNAGQNEIEGCPALQTSNPYSNPTSISNSPVTQFTKKNRNFIDDCLDFFHLNFNFDLETLDNNAKEHANAIEHTKQFLTNDEYGKKIIEAKRRYNVLFQYKQLKNDVNALKECNRFFLINALFDEKILLERSKIRIEAIFNQKNAFSCINEYHEKLNEVIVKKEFLLKSLQRQEDIDNGMLFELEDL